MTNRYDASGSQSEFQPGSDGEVLRNLLDVTSPEEMDEIELDLLDQLYQYIFRKDFPDRSLTIADLKSWHHQWLGNVYPWAGEVRNVNLSKGDFHFAAADQIPRLLDEFQETCLDRFTPSYGLSDEALSEALAITHVELILIHPFREGNGRLARLLADVMAAQTNRGLLDYSEWDRDKDRYFAAIQQGLDRTYGPMIELTSKALKD
ncbi:MAG: Fic family protein [Pseudomonadota bacterium]|nr:MAG: Fic family protein [Pseudomonadota bacterium]